MFIRKAISYFEYSNDFKRNTKMFINTLWLKLVGSFYLNRRIKSYIWLFFKESFASPVIDILGASRINRLCKFIVNNTNNNHYVAKSKLSLIKSSQGSAKEATWKTSFKFIFVFYIYASYAFYRIFLILSLHTFSHIQIYSDFYLDL